jgi:O-succinylbenzoic acid--CoA ligase
MNFSWIEQNLGKGSFISTDIEELTYDDFFDLIRSYGNYCYKKINKNEKICFISKNILDYAIFSNLLPMLGGIFVPLNPNSTKEEILNKMNIINSKKIFYDESCDINVKHFKNVELLKIKKGDLKANSIFSWPNQKETVCILFTSGTSGKPKAVELNLENIETSSHISQKNLNIRNSDKWLLCMPPFHTGGLSIIFRSLIFSKKLYIENLFDPEKVINLIMNTKVTIISLVPTMLFKIITIMEIKKIIAPKSFRFILCGGANVSENLIKRAKEIGILVIPTYGMTETTSQIATASPLDKNRPDYSVGKVLNNIKIKIDSNEEIFIQSKTVAKYYNNETSSKWLATGDTGYLDDNKYLFITGRVDDLIISGGENINPIEIENIVSNLEYVEECVAIGKKDEYWGEILTLVLFAKKKVTLDEINKHLIMFDNHKIPKKIFFYDTPLPKLDNGKFNKKLIRNIINENVS